MMFPSVRASTICEIVLAFADLEAASHPNFSKYAKLLSPGWIPGRQVDNSDDQYSTFRDNVPYMAIVLILHPLLRKVFEAIYPLKDQSSSSPSSNEPGTSPYASADARMTRRVTFDLYFGLAFLCALNGFSAPKVLIILYINFSLATQLPRAYVPAATYIFNIGILFANEFGRGYPYSDIAGFLHPWSDSKTTGADVKAMKNWGSFLDAYGGLVPRWEILFKITILRLISFNMDYIWSLDRGAASPVEVGLHLL